MLQNHSRNSISNLGKNLATKVRRVFLRDMRTKEQGVYITTNQKKLLEIILVMIITTCTYTKCTLKVENLKIIF